MKKLFWGFFFVFFNFHLSINQYTLQLLPDFVGYLLLSQGAKELETENRYFKNIQPFTVGMAVYTAILWAGELLGLMGDRGMYHQTLTGILALISTAVALYISWVLVQGVLEMESRRAADLNGGTLYQWWKGLAVLRIAGWLLGRMASLTNAAAMAMLATALTVASIVLNVLYLIAWWRAAKAWEALPPLGISEEEIE